MKTRYRPSTFESALSSAQRVRPTGMPRALPLGHTGSSKSLAQILKAGALEPRYCKVMKKRTLYLYYGGLAYRSHGTPTQEETEYPVGFLFFPRVLTKNDVHYPFDTGAMAAGIFDSTAFPSFKADLRATATGLNATKDPSLVPRLIVKHLFADNGHYLAGRPSAGAIGKPSPLPELYRFMTSAGGRADHRRAYVETQRDSSLRIGDNLLWLGYPDVLEAEVQDFLRERDPDVPLQRWSYDSLGLFRPSELCAYIQGRASAVLESFLSA